MNYDTTRTALLHPEAQPPLFAVDDDWPEGARAAEFARLAYFHFESDPAARAVLAHALRTMGFATLTTFVAAGDSQGYGAVSADGARLVLAFRGTQSDAPKDLVTDVKFALRNWRGAGRVHSGFADSLEALFPAIEAWLAPHGRAADLLVTGHSLGAALATLAAAVLPQARLVTFGSPRVGDAAFAAALSGRSVARFVDCSDIVAQVPPGPYVHVDGLRYIDRKGDVAATPPSWLAQSRDQLGATLAYIVRRGRGPTDVPVRNLADHTPVNHLGALVGGRRGP